MTKRAEEPVRQMLAETRDDSARIDGPAAVAALEGNQTVKFRAMYKAINDVSSQALDAIDSALLKAPESIHLKSFM